MIIEKTRKEILDILGVKSNTLKQIELRETLQTKLKGKGYTKSFKQLNNSEIVEADFYVFLANIYLNTYDSKIKQTKENNNKYALSFILNWITHNININKKSELFIPSIRMYNLLYDFLYK